MSLDRFSFSEPAFLYALLVVPALFAYLALVRRRPARFSVSFTNVGLLGRIARRQKTRWWWQLPLILLTLALVAATVALAQPHVQLTSKHKTALIVLLDDVSQSMEATDIPPTRLAATVIAMHELVTEVPAADKVGLVTFSDKVDVVATPTVNHAAVQSAMDTLSPQGGTALGEGIAGAVRLIVQSLAATGVRHAAGTYLPAAIVLESDGAQDRGTVSPFQAGELAKSAGVRIFGVSLGKPAGFVVVGTGFSALRVDVPPDPATVALLARISNGQSFTATNTQTLEAIYRHLGRTVGTFPQRTNISSWFDAAAAILLVAGIWSARARGAALP